MALAREISVTARLMSACEAYTGLPEGAKDKYALIRLTEKAARQIGLSPTDLRLLTLYVGYSRADDWESGAGRPAYTRPVWRTASDLGISARQVNRSETRLEALGLIFRDTRADGGRGIVREAAEDEGALVHCVDLRPLAVAWPMLEQAVRVARNHERAIDEARAAISRALRLIPRLLGEARAVGDDERFERIAAKLPQRTPRHRDLTRLIALRQQMEDAAAALRDYLHRAVDNGDNCNMAQNLSDAADHMVSDRYDTNRETELVCNAEKEGNSNRADLRKTSVQHELSDQALYSSGIDRLQITQIKAAMPDDWKFAMKRAGQFSWRLFCYIAESRLSALNIGYHAWRRLSTSIGRHAAAIAVMALEVNRSHPTNPVQNIGGAVFRFADIAAEGKLRLDAMIIGILDRRGMCGEQ